jgi:hypothetical protein
MAPKRSNEKDGKGKELELPFGEGTYTKCSITTSYILFLRVCFRGKVSLTSALLLANLFPWRM